MSAFTSWQQHGYTALLLPIARAGSRLSPYSNLTPDKLGKTPTVPTVDGWEGGVGWPQWTVTGETIAEWERLLGDYPCNIGLNARIVHGLDVDTADAGFAQMVYDLAVPLIAEAQLGMRQGRPPGFLVPFKVKTPRHKARIVAVHTATGEKSAVELLGVGQQYVIDGIHPKTGKPFTWYGTFGGDLRKTPLDRVRTVPDALFDEVWSNIARALDGHPWALVSKREAKGLTNGIAAPSPEELRAPDLEPVAECLRWLDNSPARNLDRERWVSVGFAVAAATNKSAGGWGLFERWSMQWRPEDGQHQADTAKLWMSINPATSHIGFPWLARQALAESGGRCTVAAELAFGSGQHLEAGDTVALDEGVFADPVLERPSLESVEAEIAKLTEDSKAEAINAIIALIVKRKVDPVTAEALLVEIKARTGMRMLPLRQTYMREAARVGSEAADDVGQRVAKIALATLGKDTTAWWRRQWWLYKAPVWSPCDDEIVRETVRKLVDEDKNLLMRPGNPMPLRAHQAIYEAADILKYMTSTRLAKLDEPDMPPRPAINCATSTLWINTTSGEVTTARHNPDDGFTSFIDVDYDPGATCPRYDAVLADMLSRTSHTMLAGDPGHDEIVQRVRRAEATEDRPVILPDGRRAWMIGRSLRVADVADNVRLVNEILGYSLIPWRGARVFVIFKGNGSNGKTQLVQAIAEQMPGAVVTKPIESFESPFAYSEVMGKLLLWEDDLARRVFISDGAVKKLTENKPITASVKYRNDVSFINTVFPLILCNSWPLTNDLSQGMFSRALVVPFGKTYSASDRNNNPWPAILADRRERSGMFNRLIEGLQRVIQRKAILPSKAAEEAHARWVQRSVPELSFIQDVCQHTQPEGIKSDGDTLDDLYQAYAGWYAVSIGNNRFQRGRNQFSEALEQTGAQSYASNGRIRFRGLWLNPDKVSRDLGVHYLGAGAGIVDDEADA